MFRGTTQATPGTLQTYSTAGCRGTPACFIIITLIKHEFRLVILGKSEIFPQAGNVFLIDQARTLFCFFGVQRSKLSFVSKILRVQRFVDGTFRSCFVEERSVVETADEKLDI